MTALLERLRELEPFAVYLAVGAIVFLEDALLIGFLVPGETAAIVGGVIASQADLPVWAMVAVVVVAAILGDTVGFAVGRRLGPRILRVPFFAGGRLDGARDLLRRRGGPAVFFGRFVAYLRTLMPALAAISGMPYRRFLAFNGVAATLFGVCNVLLGYAAGSSYEYVESMLGSGVWLLVGVVAFVALGWWLRRRFRTARGVAMSTADAGDDATLVPARAPVL